MTRISLIAPGRLGLARTISSWNWMIRSWEPLRGVPPGRDGSVGIWIRPSKAGKNQAFDGDRMGYLWICHQQCVFFSRYVWKWSILPQMVHFRKLGIISTIFLKKWGFRRWNRRKWIIARPGPIFGMGPKMRCAGDPEIAHQRWLGKTPHLVDDFHNLCLMTLHSYEISINIPYISNPISFLSLSLLVTSTYKHR